MGGQEALGLQLSEDTVVGFMNKHVLYFHQKTNFIRLLAKENINVSVSEFSFLQ